MDLAAFSKPAPHRIVHSVLGETLAARLLDHVLEREKAFVASKVGWEDGATDPSIRRSRILLDRSALTGEVAERFRAQMEPTVAALRLSPFTLQRMEMEFSAFGDGDFFQRHTDTGPTGPARWRTLTGVYYFHARPKRHFGGDLRMFGLMPAERGGTSVDITPEHDCMVLFASWMPHEVLPVSCPSGCFADSRFAVNVWFHRSAADSSGRS